MTKIFPLAFVALISFAVPAFAEVSISSPGSGAEVSSPFSLSAYSSSCSSQSVSAMGYSLDSSADTTIVNGTSVNAQIGSGNGWHTVHVKSWGNRGASCVTDVSVDVTGGASGLVPSNATTVSSIQTLSNWIAEYDTATGSGGASGWMAMVGSPSRSGNTRRYVTNFWGNGGERFHASFGDDTNSTNFFYDAWVYLDGSASKIANLEIDVNQTMANGQTAIFGFQCDGWTSTWDFTKNAGTPENPSDAWVHSGQYCNPRGWGQNTWHHVQVSYSRDDSGNVTYHSVWLDGKEQPINATVNSAFALGWGPSLLTNVQIDGIGTGAAGVYVDDITVSRW